MSLEIEVIININDNGHWSASAFDQYMFLFIAHAVQEITKAVFRLRGRYHIQIIDADARLFFFHGLTDKEAVNDITSIVYDDTYNKSIERNKT